MKRYDVIFNLIKDIKNPIGAEIGVMECGFSKNILTMKEDLRLYCIDPFLIGYEVYYRPGGGRQYTFENQKDFDKLYENAVSTLGKFGDRAELIRESSVEASKRIQNASLDFVFIDGDHIYESVKADIFAWAPKVKSGGFIVGHDYNTKNEDYIPNVCRAVDEIFDSSELKLSSDHCWWVIKCEENIE